MKGWAERLVCLSTDFLLTQFCLSYRTAVPPAAADRAKNHFPPPSMYTRLGRGLRLAASMTSPRKANVTSCAERAATAARTGNNARLHRTARLSEFTARHLLHERKSIKHLDGVHDTQGPTKKNLPFLVFPPRHPDELM